jgi:hypothetical protein
MASRQGSREGAHAVFVRDGDTVAVGRDGCGESSRGTEWCRVSCLDIRTREKRMENGPVTT